MPILLAKLMLDFGWSWADPVMWVILFVCPYGNLLCIKTWINGISIAWTPSPPLCVSHCLYCLDLMAVEGYFIHLLWWVVFFHMFIPRKRQNGKSMCFFLIYVCVYRMNFGQGSSAVLTHGPLVLSLSWSHSMQSEDTHFVKWMEKGWQKCSLWHVSFERPLRSRDQREQAEA